MDGEVKKMIF